MKNLAHAFDQPVDSREHQALAAEAWLGGELVSVRYWLGRLFRRNFFRESDDAVREGLIKYLVESGCEKGSQLVFDFQAWHPPAILLQDQVERTEGRAPTNNSRLVAALQAVMANPELTDSELAAIAGTTEKQIARMVEVFVLRKLWKLKTASIPPP